MKNALLISVCVSLALLVTGCHFILEEELYNNTSQDVTVDVTSAATNTTSILIKRGESVRIGYPFKLRVKITGRNWNYDLHRIPLNFQKHIGVNTHLVKAQLESNGSIFLLLPDSIIPTTNFPAQPEGFPLKPL